MLVRGEGHGALDGSRSQGPFDCAGYYRPLPVQRRLVVGRRDDDRAVRGDDHDGVAPGVEVG